MNDTLNTERLVNMSGEKIAIETFMFKRITSKWNLKLTSKVGQPGTTNQMHRVSAGAAGCIG